MTITINGREIEVTAGETVLTVARRAGIDIPHLCSLDWAPSPSASCRLCVVEVDGDRRLQTSCTLLARDGMIVRTHTPRLLKVRRAILELLVASHPQDCLTCTRAGGCELAELAGALGVRERRYVGATRQHPVDISSPALWRDPDKCVLCGRCVTTCHAVQGVGAIDFVGRGFRTRVAPGFATGLNVSDCVYCGQCARVCPTGAIVERDQIDTVVAALADPGTVVVAQIAPAVPATLLEGDSRSQGVRTMLERLAGALKHVGFDAVFDTGFAADLTIMEEAAELLGRIQGHGVLPMFTSCSPAWVRLVETRRPDLIPHLSTCKSPQQMAGSLIREIYPDYAGIGERRLVVVSIMPCTAKKSEARDQADVDVVLTTRELEGLWGRFGLDFARYPGRQPLDAPFAEATGAGRLFAGSGGVMEAALRTAARLAAGTELDGGPRIAEARGLEGVRRFDLEVAGTRLGLAVVNGLGGVQAHLDGLLADEGLHFVEVMSCPGGCVGGGGQPYDTDTAAVKRRLQRLYEVDRRSGKRRSHENADVQALYEDLLGRPLGAVSHRLLHRTYVDRRPAVAPAV